MIYRALGNTGLQPSIIGLGTVKIGRNQGVKYPTAFDLPDDTQVKNLIAQAKELGINLIDTAPAYGTSEARLGQLLRNRKDWLICSKAGESFHNGVSGFDFRPEAIKASTEESLRRLKTDYIDLMLIHSDGNDLEVIAQGALQALAELKKEGKIRAFGMSTKTVEGGIAALEQSDCAMVTLNLTDQTEVPVIEYAEQQNKGILIKKAFASGHVTNNENEDKVKASLDLIFSQPGVTSIIAGTLNQKHLAENVEKALIASN